MPVFFQFLNKRRFAHLHTAGIKFYTAPYLSTRKKFVFETKLLFHSSFFAGEHKPSTVEADITALIFFPSSCQPYMQIAVTTTLVAPLVTGGLLSGVWQGSGKYPLARSEYDSTTRFLQQ